MPLGSVAKADDSSPYLTVYADESYYLKGDTAAITVSGEASLFYRLTVYNPLGEVVYDGSKQLGLNGVGITYLPISQNFPCGTYIVEVAGSSVTSTSWFWLQRTDELKSITMPYLWNWQGINYTLLPDFTLRVEADDGCFQIDWMSEIQAKFKPTFSVYRNDYLTLIRTTGKDIDAHHWLMSQHRGLKIRINGSLAKETTLKWNFKNFNGVEVVWASNSFRMGSLVYDWGDFDRTGVSYEVDKTALKMNVYLSQAFDIDPYVFEDGFESGYTTWTGTTVDTDSTLQIDTGTVHHGVNASQSITEAVADNRTAYAYKTFTGMDTAFARLYFNVETSTGSSYFTFFRFQDVNAWRNLIQLRVTGATPYLELAWRNATDGTHTNVVSNSSKTLNLNTWHSVELTRVKSATVGEIRLYVNGTEWTEYAITNANTSDYQTERIDVGCVSNYRGSTSINIDCVVVDSSYIGVESAADSIAPTCSGISASTTSSGASSTFSCQWNDETDLTTTGGYIFGCNTSGSWNNETYVTFTSTPEWANKSKTLPTAVGQIVGYKWWANDTAGNWNSSMPIQTLTISGYTLTMQARDKDGTNLPRAVSFSVTFPNATVTAFASSSVGLKAITTMYGTHSVTVTWQTHTVKTATSVAVTADKTQNFDTLISRLSVGSSYVLISLDSTTLASPTQQPLNGWRIESIQGAGQKELKVDHANWLETGEPRFFKVRGSSYEKSADDWTWSSSIFIWANLDFSLEQYADIEMIWTDPSPPDSGTTTTAFIEPTDTTDVSAIVVTPSPMPFQVDPLIVVGVAVVGLVGVGAYVALQPKSSPWTQPKPKTPKWKSPPKRKRQKFPHKKKTEKKGKWPKGKKKQ